MINDRQNTTCYYLIAANYVGSSVYHLSIDDTNISTEIREKCVKHADKGHSVVPKHNTHYIGELVNDDMIKIMMINMVIFQLFWVVKAAQKRLWKECST